MTFTCDDAELFANRCRFLVAMWLPHLLMVSFMPARYANILLCYSISSCLSLLYEIIYFCCARATIFSCGYIPLPYFLIIVVITVFVVVTVVVVVVVIIVVIVTIARNVSIYVYRKYSCTDIGKLGGLFSHHLSEARPSD